jgi:hypothetical protein
MKKIYLVGLAIVLCSVPGLAQKVGGNNGTHTNLFGLRFGYKFSLKPKK